MKNFENQIIKEFRGRNILITGGTGSVGIALIKQLVKCKPRSIRILSNDENSIFEAKKILGSNPIYTFLLADIRDETRINFAIRGVDIVFHAAAMKHVDLCESDPFEAVKTNVLGTANILQSALLENVSKVIFISTDKATNPTSTLGASKLLAERLTVKASSLRGKGKTVFSVVRFGNVIGSRGSVFQIFLHQIKRNSPITVTDPKMTRFIMSMSQAASLILRTVNVAIDGEIFILKMPAVKIVDLAKAMVKVYEKKHPKSFVKSKIRISKAREGERINEFLITSNEIPFCHDQKDVFKITKNINKKRMPSTQFNSETARKISQKELHSIINELLEEYD